MFKQFRILEEAGEGGEGGSGGADGIQVEEQARHLGWVPQDEWKGPADKWRPANEFLARGEEIMPILKANNRRLSQQVSAQSNEVAQLRQQLAEQNEILSALKETNDEIAKERKEGQIRSLTEQIATAREANDVALESRLQARLTNLTRELEEDKEEESAGKRGRQQTRQNRPDPNVYLQSQWWQDWTEENPWYGEDPDKTQLADFVSQRLRADPKNQGLKEKAFMDKVTAEVGRLTGTKIGTSARSKVEGGGGARGAGGGGDGQSYTDLPADAKAACDRQAKRLVGDKPGMFKTEKEYRAYYAKKYFGEQT